MTSSYSYRQTGSTTINGDRRKSLPSTWRSRNKDQIIKRRAWYLHSFLCCRLDWENMEDLRRHLSASQAVKTKIRLTPEQLTFGKASRHRHHKLQRAKFQFDQIHTIEQDELFVNVLLCVFRIVESVDVQYQIFAFKFGDVADVRAIVAAYRKWAGVSESAQSVLNDFKLAESTIQARSAFGGSVHSVSMPGRPTNGTFNHAGWSSSTVGRPRTSTGYGMGRRGYSASMGDLTADGSDVFYSNGGGARMQGRFPTYQPRNGDIHTDGGAWISSRTANGYRTRSAAEQMTVTSDEGNGSLTFSDNNVVFKDVDVQITQRVDPNSQPVFNYQRYKPYLSQSSRGGGQVADISCQVNFPDGMTEQQMYIAGVLSGGAAVVVTGQPMVPRITLNSASFLDDDDDDESLISGVSSLAYGPEPGLTRHQPFNNRDGVAVANVRGYTAGRQVANGRMSFDESDSSDFRRPASMYNNRNGPDMTSSVHRVYSRAVSGGPAVNGHAYHNGYYDDFAARRSRSRPSESDGYFQRSMARSRSVEPLSGGRYNGYGMYSSQTDLYRPDNFDAMSVTSGRSARSAPRSARHVRQTAALISPTVKLNYATRHEVAIAGPQSATSTIYRQAPRPRGPSSAYGGVRNRTQSHRMQ